MKHLHRLIVTSQAYQMQSTGGHATTDNARIDPDNHYLWRMNVRRMEAEVIRDSLLHLAGRLDIADGGADLPLGNSGHRHGRRSIYYRYARGDRIPFLVMFDAPSVEECYRRDETIVPQQALALTNSGIALAQATRSPRRSTRRSVTRRSPEARSAFVVSAFERVLGRTPTAGEQSECVRALDRLRETFPIGERRQGRSPTGRHGPRSCMCY